MKKINSSSLSILNGDKFTIMSKNHFVLFSNIKGGIGKSSLCTLFAHYLTAKGEDVAVIIKEADRLIALVNEIMEYSELKSEGMTDEFEKIDISQLVNRAAVSFENLKKPEGIIVEKDIEENIFVNGNESRLERALYNLMDNAARHTGDSRKIKISLVCENDRAVISVTDYGSGIPENELENIWDRYYTTRMRKGKGVSGLGLAIVRQITELHRGVCYARSKPDKGSTFIIELPCSV